MGNLVTWDGSFEAWKSNNTSNRVKFVSEIPILYSGPSQNERNVKTTMTRQKKQMNNVHIVCLKTKEFKDVLYVDEMLIFGIPRDPSITAELRDMGDD